MKRKILSILIITFFLNGCIYRPIPGSESVYESNEIEIPTLPIHVETDEDYGFLSITDFRITSTLPANGNETEFSANYIMVVSTDDPSKEEIGFDFSYYNEEGFKIGWYSFKEKTTSPSEISIKGNLKIPVGTTSITFGKTSD